MHGPLSSTFIIKGKASNKTTTLRYSEKDLQTILMLFLHQNSIPIASSCRGEGVCKKCTLAGVLSCQITLEQYIKNYGDSIEIDYW